MVTGVLGSKRLDAIKSLGLDLVAKGKTSNPAKRKQQAEAMIDAFMQKVGYKNPAERTDEEGWRYFGMGSAEGRAGVFENEGDLFLCVEAPIVPLPSDKELILPLIRELLELNLQLPGEVRVGLVGEHVQARALSAIGVIREDDFARCIHSVMGLADNLDDHLKEQYGGTTKRRSRSARQK